MADYKRIVSYIYNYEFNMKKSNVGYARLETIGKQCKITVHINVMSMNETALEVCFFLREQNRILCVPLGKMVPRNGIGDFRAVTEAENLMDSGYSLENMGGMLIYASTDKYFGTEWDDKPIVLREFLLAGKKGHTAVLRAAELALAEEAEALPEERTPTKETVEEEAGEPAPRMEMEETPLSERDEKEEQPELDKEDRGPEKAEEAADLAEQPEEREEQPEKREENKEEAGKNRPGFEPERIAKIFQSYPKMYPFEDHEILECVRIELQDIGVFPVECWELANNSFLLHGYYSYRHLVFAKKGRGRGEEYLIGVPGYYYNREKFMAGMFGFHLFKSIKKTEEQTGEFGYWLKRIS